jgi:hypothetical protein
MKNRKKIILCLSGILLLSCLIAHGGEPCPQSENTGKVIEYLLDHVSNSHLAFTRNGSEHSGRDAAAHMRKKYAHFISHIKTPEDFIDLCASKSLVSGKPYLVSTAQGRVPVGEWLGEILTEHRKKQRLL